MKTSAQCIDHVNNLRSCETNYVFIAAPTAVTDWAASSRLSRSGTVTLRMRVMHWMCITRAQNVIIFWAHQAHSKLVQRIYRPCKMSIYNMLRRHVWYYKNSDKSEWLIIYCCCNNLPLHSTSFSTYSLLVLLVTEDTSVYWRPQWLVTVDFRTPYKFAFILDYITLQKCKVTKNYHNSILSSNLNSDSNNNPRHNPNAT